MRTKILTVIGLLLAFDFVCANDDSQNKIAVVAFYTADNPIAGTSLDGRFDVEIYDVRASERLEKQLSFNMPRTELAARKRINKIINKEGKERFEKRLVNAYRPLMKAIEFSIERVPAIVFDKELVVYGVTDIASAIEIYNQRLNSRNILHE